MPSGCIQGKVSPDCSYSQKKCRRKRRNMLLRSGFNICGCIAFWAHCLHGQHWCSNIIKSSWPYLNISQMKRETDLLKWHCLMNSHLPSSPGERWWAGISLQNSRSWARQSQISILVIQDQKITADTAVLALFLKCLVWMNGMALFFSLRDIIPIPCAAPVPGRKSSPFFTTELAAFQLSESHLHVIFIQESGVSFLSVQKLGKTAGVISLTAGK